jgi:biotin carboxylase
VGRTVLIVGAGRHQRRAIRRARDLGLRVAALDRNADAPGFADCDEARVVDFSDVAAAIEAARAIEPDGVLTIAADRAVPVVAAVAEALGLPGIGSEAALAATNKAVMRRRFADAGILQPQFAVLPGGDTGSVGFPAVVKPVDSAGQRGLFLVQDAAELEERLPAALAESRTGEAIVEQFHEGLEVNCLAVDRGGEVEIVTLSDRQRPDGIGFGVCLAHTYPSSLESAVRREAERVARESVRAVGLRDSVAYPQLLVSGDGVRVVEIAARVPGGQMDQVARLGVGVDLVEVALRQALGDDIPDELVRPARTQPLAIRFLTSSPGPLPAGVVTSVNGIDRARAAPGVVDAQSAIAAGETIRPVQNDGDRRGFVIALGDSVAAALERADAAAGLVEVEVA